MAASGHIIANKHVSLCYHNVGQPRPQGCMLPPDNFDFYGWNGGLGAKSVIIFITYFCH